MIIKEKEMNNQATHLYHPEILQVRLLPGTPFYDRQQDMNEYLRSLDPDTMLYNFRTAAGLPTLGAAPMTGWDADECKLKGHTTGHYLSALSLAYAATGDEDFGRILDRMIAGLRECQLSFEEKGKTHKGFLSAYDETQFDLLEKFTPYPDIWAPYYTLDKIMAGLLDAYELAGKTEALEILDPLGDWIYDRLSAIPDDQRSEMWSMYIAGEYGAMIGTLVRLHRITGKTSHLAAARLFENPALFGQMAAGTDGLDSMHANQHIPQIIGALELYAETGDSRYYDIADNFWHIVTGHHIYAIGGTGEEERFRAADAECRFLTEKTAESCASVNMLRLTGRLYEFAGEQQQTGAELMAYYERTLFNHILMSCSHRPDGGTTYFMPLAPGSRKYYEREENSCCHGTGMESRYRYMRDIFSFGDGLLRVELPVSARLDGDEHVTVRFTDDGRITVTAEEDMTRRVAVRVPEWADAEEDNDGYLTTDRCLRAGESVTFEFPVRTEKVPAESDDTYCYVRRGPYLLAAVSDETDFIELPDRTGNFSFDGRNFVPLYTIDGEPYHIYFRNGIRK